MSVNISLAEYQRSAIAVMVDAMCSAAKADAVVLHAPTASGKTLMAAHAVDGASGRRKVIWLWLAPYSVIVAQTKAEIAAVGRLKPKSLDQRTYGGHENGDVYVATAQAVVTEGGRASEDTEEDGRSQRTVPSVLNMVRDARAEGFGVGLVVDEAHIGLNDETKLGALCREVDPEAVLAVTATPDEHVLKELFDAMGRRMAKTISISRADVVRAKLNKEAVYATVYVPKDRGVDDQAILRVAVRKAWERNVEVGRALAVAGLSGIVPLMLVQVEDGDEAPMAMRDFLVGEMDLVPESVVVHTSTQKDGAGLMQIASSGTIRVLIYKRAAATGFNPTRAFVMVSARTVLDKKDGVQFLGRTMRVHPSVRAALERIPAEARTLINSAHLFLTDGEQQSGLLGAAKLVNSIKTDLGQGGSDAIVDVRIREVGTMTEREAAVEPEPGAGSDTGSAPDRPFTVFGGDVQVAGTAGPAGECVDAAPCRISASPEGRRSFSDETSLRAWLGEQGLAAIILKKSLSGRALAYSERRPDVSDHVRLAYEAGRQLPIGDGVLLHLGAEIRGEVAVTEMEIEVFSNDVRKSSAVVAGGAAGDTFRRYAEEADSFLSTHKHLVDTGVRDRFLAGVVETLHGKRFVPPKGYDNEDFLHDLAKRAAFRAERANGEVTRAFSRLFIGKASLIETEPVPDLLLVPAWSRRGPMFSSCIQESGHGWPTEDIEMTAAEKEALRSWRSVAIDVDGRALTVSVWDAGWAMNSWEQDFAAELDGSEHVRWWFRNPDRKPFSVAMLRADSPDVFYPDFVACLPDGTLRAADPKHSESDARSKGERDPSQAYGKTVFFRKDGDETVLYFADGREIRMSATADPLGDAFAEAGRGQSLRRSPACDV